MDIENLLATITPEIMGRMKTALELGKWPDGRALTAGQKEITMQAVLAWDARHLPEEQRTGYMSQTCQSGREAADKAEEQSTILRFQDA